MSQGAVGKVAIVPLLRSPSDQIEEAADPMIGTVEENVYIKWALPGG